MQVEIAAVSEDVDSSASVVVHDSPVGGTATGYGLDGSEFKPRSGHGFSRLHTLSERPWGSPNFLNNGYQRSTSKIK